MFSIVIPARFGSTRLPGKALADIAGKPMVWHVWQRAVDCGADEVIVATDDARIADALAPYNVDIAMTRTDHASGTDRLAEVAEQRGWSDEQIVVNLQGDEPLMPTANLIQVAELLAGDPGAAMATLSEPINSRQDFENPAVVKVVSDARGRALYFSRAAIPHARDGAADAVPRVSQRHIGLYAYRAGFLRAFTAMPPTPLEQLESLEQLRALEQGQAIGIAEAAEPVPGGVDTAEDLDRIRQLMGG